MQVSFESVVLLVTPPRPVDFFISVPQAPSRIHMAHSKPRYAKRKLKMTETGNTEKVRKRCEHVLYEPGICTICMCRLPRSNNRYVTPCGHVFHTSCIDAMEASSKNEEEYYWLKREQVVQNCPNCREEFIR